ncbi:NifU family protein [Hallerella sp.]|uniref:NifU family protein n=1 Tax=Hallerella sp. TaxID=2815812 RepID=UPI00258B6803|nr:NifU family protein [Hallerella sp.]MCI6873387.1 NifU family protein [Hallerella sp.]
MSEISESYVSEKVKAIARAPKYRGAIFQVEADERGLALIDGKEESLKIYITVDPEKDQIVETRFFTYGGPIFTALADTLCERLQGKAVEYLGKTDVNQLEKELRDDPETPAFSTKSAELASLQKLIAKLIASYPEKKAVALAARETMEKVRYRTQTVEGRNEADKEWAALSKEERLQRIADCLHLNVRQALQNDGGDLEIVEMMDDTHVKIRFQGACNGCSASTGGTLYYIEDQLRDNVYYNLSVIPEDAFSAAYNSYNDTVNSSATLTTPEN